MAAFARGLDHPRWLHVLPNGDVLVAETNAPPRPDDNKGIRGWFFKRYQKRAGGAVPSANRITLLRDADGDGVAEMRSVFLSGLAVQLLRAARGFSREAATPDLVAAAIRPDYALGPHTASLGLAHARETSLPTRFSSGMLVGQHGSWNRKPRSGYKVIFVPFADGRPSGDPIDVLTGFVKRGHAMGRPVGVALDARGAMLVADDVGNVIWRVSGASAGR